MDIIWWMNRLNLGDEILTYVGNHYFKHLLFVKLMSGTGLNEEDVSNCSFNVESNNCLEFEVKLKGKNDVKTVVDVIGDNLSNLSYDITINKKKITARIWTDNEQGELYSNGNILNSYA